MSGKLKRTTCIIICHAMYGVLRLATRPSRFWVVTSSPDKISPTVESVGHAFKQCRQTTHSEFSPFLRRLVFEYPNTAPVPTNARFLVTSPSPIQFGLPSYQFFFLSRPLSFSHPSQISLFNSPILVCIFLNTFTSSASRFASGIAMTFACRA